MKNRVQVIIVASLLFAGVIGWFLAAKNRGSTIGILTTPRPVSAPVPRPPQPAASPPSVPSVVQSTPPAASVAAPVVMARPERPLVPPAMPAPLAPAAAVPNPSAPPTPSSTPEATEQALLDMDQLILMIRDYRTIEGTNPVGTNSEIMKAVMGGNSKEAKLGPPEGQSLNGQGELVDRWGTAYFFHQMSATHMEIHSAGPDKTFGTPDDLVSR
jgi:hypothetical protein